MTSTVVVTIGAVTLALLLLGVSGAALLVYLRREWGSEKRGGYVLEELVNGHGIRISELEVLTAGMPSLWEDERKRAKRDADSARKARQFAEEKLEQVEELIAENTELPLGDGEGGGAREMHPVSTGLAPDHEPGIEDRVAAVAHLLRT